MGSRTASEVPDTAQALALVRRLCDDVGPRRPCSRAERLAATLIADVLAGAGLDPRLQRFAGYSSFAQPYGAIAALSLVPSALGRSRSGLRAAPAALAAAALLAEGSLIHTPVSDLLARSDSHNVTATIEPAGRARRTLCLMAHMDSSRSGLLFHPRLQRLLGRWLALQSLATLGLAAEPLLTRSRNGRRAVTALRAVAATGLGLLAERELRGVDVPGANDNASGVGAVVQLGCELARRPPDSTRVVILVCGCEEAGLLGAQAFLREHDTDGWLFLNFDGVAAPATLRYLPAEGLLRKWPADPALVAIAQRLERERPELGLAAADAPIGLTYDATAVLARGGRALTLVAGDRGAIPNYHQPSDTVENLDLEAFGRALAVGRELIARIDGGAADPGSGR